MEKWHWNKTIKVFCKLQRGEGLYWFLEILNAAVMSMSIYLFLFVLWLYNYFLVETHQSNEEFENVLKFSQKGLHILIVVCFFIGVLTLQSLCYFRSVKNQRRSAVLRILGLWGRWKNIYELTEAFVVAIVSFFPGFVGARILFLATVKEIIGTEYVPTMQGYNMLIRIFIVSVSMVLMLIVSYRIAGFSEEHKSMGERIRGTEHLTGAEEKGEKGRLFFFFMSIYLILLFAVAEQVTTIIIGTFILFLLGLCNCLIGKAGVGITENLVNKYRNKKRYRAEFLHIALETGGIRNRKNVFLITLMATGLLLLYFLLSIDWGLENFLERFWIQSRQTNIYLETEYGKEQNIEDFLLKEGVSYQKLYVKEWAEEGLTLAVSDCKDTSSPYYVQEGYLKTILYNLYRWEISEGEVYQLSEKELIIDEPMNEEGFQLINYSCLINYEDWIDKLDETYTVVYAAYVDKNMLAIIESWTEENGVGLMTPSRYMDMVKQIYAPYLRILETIMLILSFSILLFLFASILSSIIARQKEFYIYWGCGVGWKKIRNLVLVQYLYIALIGSCVSALVYCIIFNGFKRLWFGNSTVYFVEIKQIVMITILVFIFIGAECYVSMKFIQKQRVNVATQLRAE